MIKSAGTKIKIVEGDNIRKKGSVGYVSSFLPIFNTPCMEVFQIIVFTRLGKKGKHRLVVMPIISKVLEPQSFIKSKDWPLFEKIALRENLLIKNPPKCLKWSPSRSISLKTDENDAAMDLMDWDWVDFFAYISAILIHLEVAKRYYKYGTIDGPNRIPRLAPGLEGEIRSSRLVPAAREPWSAGGLLNMIDSGSIRGAKTLMKALTAGGGYNIDYMQRDFRLPEYREAMMKLLRRTYAKSMPALKFYDAYLSYYKSISFDFTKFALQRYRDSKNGYKGILDQIERDNPDLLNVYNSELFTRFASNILQECDRHGRHQCRYVTMMPGETAHPELVSNHPGLSRIFSGNRPQGGLYFTSSGRTRPRRRDPAPEPAVADDQPWYVPVRDIERDDEDTALADELDDGADPQAV